MTVRNTSWQTSSTSSRVTHSHPLALQGATLQAVAVATAVRTGGASPAVFLAELRETGLSADRAYGGRSLRAQTKSADRAGARYVVLIGRAEMEKGAVAVRDMQTGEQVEVPRSRVVAWLHDHLDPTHRDAHR